MAFLFRVAWQCCHHARYEGLTESYSTAEDVRIINVRFG